MVGQLREIRLAPCYRQSKKEMNISFDAFSAALQQPAASKLMFISFSEACKNSTN